MQALFVPAANFGDRLFFDEHQKLVLINNLNWLFDSNR